MTQYIGCNNIEKADEIIRYLLHNEYPRKAILYAIYSNLELLKNNTEKSYEYAKMALEIDKDNPNSEIHQFYVSRSIRCNKEEGTAYIPEYASLFPRHNTWLKSVKALETDEDGNEVLTQEIKDFFTSSSKRFNTILTGYSNRKIGISILAKMQNQSIPQILDWRSIYGIKAMVYQGFIQEIYKEVNIFSNKIIVDAFTMYILAEIGYLRILENLETVYITYSTIESLQQVILTREDGKVRDVLNFINQSLNVEIVYPDFDEISKIDVNFLDFFFKDQLDSSIYSYSNKIPYLYSDYFVKGSMAERNEYFIGLVAFIRALLGQSIINKETLSDFIYKLKKNQYEFINFDSEDIYNAAKKSNFVVEDDIKLFFTIDKYSEFPSFAIAYVGFLRKVYGEIERHKFDAYVDLYIELFDKYIRKTRYYFQTLEVKFPDFEKEMDRYGNKNSLSSIMLFEELGSEVLMKIITNTYEFIRIKAILEGTDGALRYFLYMFKNNDEEYEYYSQKVRKQCINFFPEEVEIIIKQTKEFDLAKMIESQKEEKN